MILRDTLEGILRDQKPPDPTPGEVRRSLAASIPADSAHAIVLTGVRRSGKSTLMSQLLRKTKSSVFINFEDPRLFGLGPRDFPTLLSVLDERYPGATAGLDEVQEVPEWQRLVRALLDRRRHVLATGSNASLLGKELGAKLTGRHLSFRVLPFSYEEYLSFTDAKPSSATLAGFLDDGGFPSYLRERNPEILRELFRDIVHRDIGARHQVREMRHIMNLALFLLAHTGRPFSFQGLTKSLQIPTVAQTSRYVEYLQDAFLIQAVPKYSPSFRKRVTSPPKYYAIDNGLRRANSPAETLDVGHRLENAVLLQLLRQGRTASYAGERDRWECDFVTEDSAIQVCAELNEFNRDREIRGVIEALKLPGKVRRGLILTMAQTDRFEADGSILQVLPAWRWLTMGG